MEKTVDNLLKAAKLRDEDITETEDKMLQRQELSPEEVLQRRSELRKMKELLFRAEVKAKRIAKIKSKTYRKLKRKEREKIASALQEDDDEEDEEKRTKREIERAKERATLKHRSSGTWARQLKGRTGWDDEARTGVEEMLDRGEKLRRKIAGITDDDEGGSEAESDDDDDDTLIRKAVEDAEELRTDTSAVPSGSKSDLFGLKFMKDAMERREKRAHELIDDFVQSFGDKGAEEEDPEATNEDTIITRNGGRISLRPADMVKFTLLSWTFKLIFLN